MRALRYATHIFLFSLVTQCTPAQSLKDLARRAKDKLSQSTATPSQTPSRESPTNPTPGNSTPPSSTSNGNSASGLGDQSGASVAPIKGSGNVEQTASTVPDSTGPLVYTYCFTTDNGKVYVSDVFTIHGKIAGQQTMPYRRYYLHPKYVDPFKQMVDIKYGFAFAKQTNYGCEDGYKTREQAETLRKGLVNPNAEPPSQFIETGWKGTNEGVLVASETSTQATSSRELNRLLAKEHEDFTPFCQNTPLFAENLDCSCFATHMTETRSRQVNSLGGGGATLMPRMSELYKQANLVGCTSRDRLQIAAANNLKSFSMSSEKKQALMACVPAKVATLVLAQPDALFEIHRYNGDTQTALTQCSAGR